MKFIVSSAELLKGILAVSKAIPAKSSQPILENFLFVLDGNVLEITASDTELTLKTDIEVESSEENGEIAVPARHITELLKELPDQPLSIATTGDSSFECIWANGTSTLPFFPASDYPAIATTDDNALSLTFPAQSLVDGIAGTIYATADENPLPYSGQLSGRMWKTWKSRLTARMLYSSSTRPWSYAVSLSGNIRNTVTSSRRTTPTYSG